MESEASQLMGKSWEKVKQFRNGAMASGAKLALIGLLMALLIIPMSMIQGLITEREKTRGEAEKEVAEKWGGDQQLAGPILTVPYRVYQRVETAKGKVRVDTSVAYAHFLPEEMDVLGSLLPEVRHRGIFDIALFKADLDLEGRFLQPDFSAWNIPAADVLWGEAFLSIALPDVRSLADALPVDWQGRPARFEPDPGKGLLEHGLMAKVALRPPAVDLPGAVTPAAGYPFHFRLRLNGSGHMHFLPVAKETRVSLRSTWPSPSFTGAFLPEEHSVDKKGFQARWKTLYLSRSFPQQWQGSSLSPADLNRYAFGVELLLPVDGYQKTTRCAKYASLFILLTFMVFFLFETFDRTRIHSLQYLLVGFALSLFYLLLLALTEHIPFVFAYAAASTGTVGLISCYAVALSTKKRALALGAMLAGLYGYLYSLLQMEDYALLMGALGMFVILAAVMFLTRRINWYGVKAAATAAAGAQTPGAEPAV